MTAELVFWSAVAALFYTYAGYHLLLRFAALFAPAERAAPLASTDAPALTPISILAAVYNEERIIEARLQNLLRLDYPHDQLEIIVASDGSTDRTHEIVRHCAARAAGRVRLLELGRVGKGPAQDAAVAAARGEIVIFTDADTEFAPDFARVVADHFARDPRVGALAVNLNWKMPQAWNAPSRLRQLSWKLETDLRQTESRLGLLAGASGAAMALRRSLWKPMRFAVNDSDSLTPLDVIRQGYKVIFARDAVAYEAHFTSARSDFRAKVRGVSKSIATIPFRWPLRDWARHPFIAWRTVSHHLLRWVAPYLMLAAVAASLFLLSKGPVYQAIVLAEAALAALAAAGYVAERRRKPLAVASLVYSFLAVNAGFAWGLIKGVRGAAQGLFETE